MSGCAKAWSARIDVELGLATADERARLAAHLAGCAACASWAARESALTAALLSLRGPAPTELDVRASVAARIAGRRAVVGRDASVSALGWSAVAAVATSAALMAGLWRLGPDVRSLVSVARVTVDALGATAAGLVAPLAATGAALAKLAGHLLASLGSLTGALETLQGLALVTVALCSLTMAAGIAVVVGRDVRRPHWIGEGPRP